MTAACTSIWQWTITRPRLKRVPARSGIRPQPVERSTPASAFALRAVRTLVGGLRLVAVLLQLSVRRLGGVLVGRPAVVELVAQSGALHVVGMASRCGHVLAVPRP